MAIDLFNLALEEGIEGALGHLSGGSCHTTHVAAGAGSVLWGANNIWLWVKMFVMVCYKL